MLHIKNMLADSYTHIPTRPRTDFLFALELKGGGRNGQG